MDTMLLCRDGILRARRRIHDRFRDDLLFVDLPVSLLDARDGPVAFLSLLQAELVLDRGLTVAELFRCLAPWSALLRGIAHLDFATFAREAAAPQPPDRFDDLSRVELYCFAEIKADPAPGGGSIAFERIPGSHLYDLRFGAPRPRRVSDRRRLAFHWDHRAPLRRPRQENGMLLREVSLLGAPLSLWHHLPLTIARRMDVTDGTLRSEHLSSPEAVLNAACPAVRRGGSKAWQTLTARLCAPEPTFFETIVRGLLWEVGWFGAPAQRDAAVATITAEDAAAESEARHEAAPPEDRAARERRIAAEIAAEEEAEREAYRRTPFDARDRETIALAEMAETERPGSVRFPRGRPRA